MIDAEAFKRSLLEVESTATEKLVQQYIDQKVPAEAILNEGLIAALEMVGQDWKVKKLWIPDVLLAAQNIHKGVDFLRPGILDSNIPCRGVLLVGTVHGDIHDIGKNIVATLMEAHGFRVIDLGVNVPTGTFADAVATHKPDIVGLSALLTTTMQEMKKVIAVVRESGLIQGTKVIVGGAPVTLKFADEIGADGYGEDAISGVEVALKLLEDGK
jgi:5-methyltetrahydrofolate--homocysteine methyltransferase